ncbi:MAG: hypothetical protein K8W52_04535 [Deltaproteobacteria bacterium]|nr:hypothetical protein [Deltaproteobacteria bacterium]
MIGFRWTTSTIGPCVNCRTPVTLKRNYLLLFYIPIPLGGPSMSCACPAGHRPQLAAQAQAQVGAPMLGIAPVGAYPGAAPMAMAAAPMSAAPIGAPMAYAPAAAAPAVAMPVYPCLQCQTTLLWAAPYQRWFCPRCQQYR